MWTYSVNQTLTLTYCGQFEISICDGTDGCCAVRPIVWWELRNRHPQILSHALARPRLHVRNERRLEGHLRSPSKRRVANYSIISVEILKF